MKSKQQKGKEIQQAQELADGSKAFVFVDFSGTPVAEITKLKSALRELGAAYKVVKKRLLRIVFQEKGIDVDAKGFEGQLATVFSPADISDAAGTVYRFSKNLGKDAVFKIVGGYDKEAKRFFDAQEIVRVGQLPSRAVLLAQLAGLMKAPLNQLAYVLSQIGEKKQ